MAERRVEKLSHAIRDIVSDVMCKELSDPRISPFASITRVDVSGDLQEACVHISVLGSEVEGSKTLAGLRHASGRIQRLMAGRLTVRRCPHLRFELDDSIKRGAAVVRLIDESVASDQRDAARREAAEREAAEREAAEGNGSEVVVAEGESGERAAADSTAEPVACKAGSPQSDMDEAQDGSSSGIGSGTGSSPEIDARERRLHE